MRKTYAMLIVLALLSLAAAPLTAETVIPGGTTPYAWYRADMGVGTSGSTVTAWTDQSGSGRDLTSVTGTPQLTANGTIAFDGYKDYLESSVAAWGTAGAGTVIAVWKRAVIEDSPVSTSEVRALYDCNTGATNRQFLWTSMTNDDPSSKANLVYGSGPDPIGANMASLSPPPVPADTWVVTSATYTTDGSFFVNGVEEFSGNLQSGGMSGLIIGNYISKAGNGRGSFEGELAELVVFGEPLAAQERSQIEQSLGARWGVDVVPEPTSLTLWLCGVLMMFALRRVR